MQIEFTGAFEGLRKDREGEVKLILAIPLSDEAKVREIPVQTTLKITIESEDCKTSNYGRRNNAIC